jgi:hypothetical protein
MEARDEIWLDGYEETFRWMAVREIGLVGCEKISEKIDGRRD